MSTETQAKESMTQTEVPRMTAEHLRVIQSFNKDACFAALSSHEADFALLRDIESLVQSHLDTPGVTISQKQFDAFQEMSNRYVALPLSCRMKECSGDTSGVRVPVSEIEEVMAGVEGVWIREDETAVMMMRRWLSGASGVVTDTRPIGILLIAAERQRQIEVEGWTAEHDDKHNCQELALAAACYAWPAPRPDAVKNAWPWNREWWKPDANRQRDLVRAGALIAAELDRLARREGVST